MPTLRAPMYNTATFSPCRTWRYTLWRRFDLDPNAPFAMFIGLNPSTADEYEDDPTIRRCIGYAKSWGCGALLMTNAFAYRATNPEVMKAQSDPVGPDNDDALLAWSEHASIVVAAWGEHGRHLDRHDRVRQLVPNLHYLKLNKDGTPAHPLYLRADLTPRPWSHASH